MLCMTVCLFFHNLRILLYIWDDSLMSENVSYWVHSFVPHSVRTKNPQIKLYLKIFQLFIFLVDKVLDKW
jgi:hypothetical protein